MPNNRDNENILEKSDLETIIKVNNKAIELQTETNEQYEEVISKLNIEAEKTKNVKEDITEIKKDIKEISKTQWKILVLLGAGIANLIFQVISMFKK